MKQNMILTGTNVKRGGSERSSTESSEEEESEEESSESASQEQRGHLSVGGKTVNTRNP